MQPMQVWEVTKNHWIRNRETGSRRLAHFFAPTLALLLCGCSSFNRDWRHTPAPSQNGSSIEGRWQGQWISEVNGHHGNLRCLVVRKSDSICQARFRATYGHALHFTYTVALETQPHEIGWEFNGEANLGKLAGGIYYYEGRATPTNLVSTYKSKYDHGRFELTRTQ